MIHYTHRASLLIKFHEFVFSILILRGLYLNLIKEMATTTKSTRLQAKQLNELSPHGKLIRLCESY